MSDIATRQYRSVYMQPWHDQQLRSLTRHFADIASKKKYKNTLTENIMQYKHQLYSVKYCSICHCMAYFLFLSTYFFLSAFGISLSLFLSFFLSVLRFQPNSRPVTDFTPFSAESSDSAPRPVYLLIGGIWHVTLTYTKSGLDSLGLLLTNDDNDNRSMLITLIYKTINKIGSVIELGTTR